MENLFLKAAKKKFRFKTAKGPLNVEQLFSLTKGELNELYLSLEANTNKSPGLLGKSGNTEMEDKQAIVKEVFNTLMEAQERKAKLAANKVLKAKLLERIEAKEMGEFDNKPLSELKKMVKELDSATEE